MLSNSRLKHWSTPIGVSQDISVVSSLCIWRLWLTQRSLEDYCGLIQERGKA